jgi:hypothetical protein
MTIHSVYLGDLEDPNFSWEGGDWNGNTPRAISHQFPDCYHLFFKVMDLAKEGGENGRQTDFGAFVVKLKKAEIIALIDKWYAGKTWDPKIDSYTHFSEQLAKLKTFVAGLDSDKLYALVGTEL